MGEDQYSDIDILLLSESEEESIDPDPITKTCPNVSTSMRKDPPEQLATSVTSEQKKFVYDDNQIGSSTLKEKNKETDEIPQNRSFDELDEIVNFIQGPIFPGNSQPS